MLAGKELGVTAAAVGHRIRTLEKHLDAELFERRRRSVHLNRRGQTYLKEVQRILAEVHGVSEQQRATPRRVIHRSMPSTAPRFGAGSIGVGAWPSRARGKRAMPARELGMTGSGMSGGFSSEVSQFAPRQVPSPGGRCKRILPPAAIARLPGIEVGGAKCPARAAASPAAACSPAVRAWFTSASSSSTPENTASTPSSQWKVNSTSRNTGVHGAS